MQQSSRDFASANAPAGTLYAPLQICSSGATIPLATGCGAKSISGGAALTESDKLSAAPLALLLGMAERDSLKLAPDA